MVFRSGYSLEFYKYSASLLFSYSGSLDGRRHLIILGISNYRVKSDSKRHSSKTDTCGKSREELTQNRMNDRSMDCIVSANRWCMIRDFVTLKTWILTVCWFVLIEFANPSYMGEVGVTGSLVCFWLEILFYFDWSCHFPLCSWAWYASLSKSLKQRCGFGNFSGLPKGDRCYVEGFGIRHDCCMNSNKPGYKFAEIAKLCIFSRQYLHN